MLLGWIGKRCVALRATTFWKRATWKYEAMDDNINSDITELGCAMGVCCKWFGTASISTHKRCCTIGLNHSWSLQIFIGLLLYWCWRMGSNPVFSTTLVTVAVIDTQQMSVLTLTVATILKNKKKIRQDIYKIYLRTRSKGHKSPISRVIWIFKI
jgi:hypothetical protein